MGVTPYYQDDAVTIYHGDCAEVLPRLPVNIAAVTITDPPYNVGKDYGEHDDRMAQGEYEAWLRAVLTLCRPLTEDGLVFFPGTSNVLDARNVLDGTGWIAHRVLGWHRKEFAGDKWNGGPAMAWEPVVWASQVDRPFFNTIFGTAGRDFLVVNATHGNPWKGPHPCPKPLSVMRWLVGLFAPADGLVLDPFAGSGTTLLAAKDSGRRAIGIEREERFCELAALRVQGKRPDRLTQEVFAR